MGATQQAGFATLDWNTGLDYHLAGNFFPPLPGYVRRDIKSALKQYNDGLIDIDQCAKLCWLRNADCVYKYFHQWLTREG